MSCKIEVAPAVERQLKKLPFAIQKRMILRLEKLKANPRPAGVKKLESGQNLYRINAGDYQIIYQVQDKILLILVVKIGHRREVYRK
jgi:mRNA interferase RelE/StbE